MAVIGELLVNLRASTASFTKDLKRATQISFGSSKEIERSMKVIGKAALAAGAAAAGVLALVGKASLSMAMDAVESENLFTVSLGKMADSARRWSDETARALGLNSFELRKNLGTFDVMLKSMGLTEEAALDMSKALTVLAFDMASFFNLRPEEAFQKLRSGITGEVEPLKRLGVVVNEETVKLVAYREGIAKVGEQLTNAQKIQARYVAILEQTQAAHGDLARTIDSPSNAIRVLRSQVDELMIQFGTALIPAAQGVVKILQDLVFWFRASADNLEIVGKAAIIPVNAFRVLAASALTSLAAVTKLVEGFLKINLLGVKFANQFGFRKKELPFAEAMISEAKAFQAELKGATNLILGDILKLADAAENLDKIFEGGGGAFAGVGDTGGIAKKAKKRIDPVVARLEAEAAILRSLKSELDSVSRHVIDELNRVPLFEDLRATDQAVKDSFAFQLPEVMRHVFDEMSKIPPLYSKLQEGARRWGQEMQHSFTQMILHGASFRETLRGLVLLMAEMILQTFVFKTISNALFGKGGFLGVIGSFFGGLAGLPGRAHGGPVEAGRGYLVGERGPEVFVPAASGAIVPSGASAQIVFNIDARGADAAVEYRVARAIKAMEARMLAAAQIQSRQAALRS